MDVDRNLSASLAPEGDTGTTLAPSRPRPDLDDGDHDRMAHIVLEGFEPDEGDFVSTGPIGGPSSLYRSLRSNPHKCSMLRHMCPS